MPADNELFLDDLQLALIGQAPLLSYMKKLWSTYLNTVDPAERFRISSQLLVARGYCTHRNADGLMAVPNMDGQERTERCPHCHQRWEGRPR